MQINGILFHFFLQRRLQFPIKLSQHHDKTAADHLGLNYVTERILASVLPTRIQNQRHKRDNEFNDGQHGDASEIDESPQDIYEQELISMLEQKHGKVNKRNFLMVLHRNQSIDGNLWPTARPVLFFFLRCFCLLVLILNNWLHTFVFSFQNYKLFDLESCISTITLEKLCELCKHMDAWLGSGREKVVILQDRWVWLQTVHTTFINHGWKCPFFYRIWLIRLRAYTKKKTGSSGHKKIDFDCTSSEGKKCWLIFIVVNDWMWTRLKNFVCTCFVSIVCVLR